MINQLPQPPASTADTTRDQYRASLALYVLVYLPEHGALVTAALDDAQLEDAAHGLHAAVCHRPIVLGDVPTPVSVYDAIAQAKAFVRLMQDGRAKEAAAAVVPALDALLSAGIDSHPRNGKTVPIPDPPQPRVPPANVELAVLRQRVQEAF